MNRLLLNVSRLNSAGTTSESEPSAAPKRADNLDRIAMLAVHRFIYCPHVIRAHFAGKRIEGSLNLRPALESTFPYERNRLIGRKVVPIILKDREPHCLDRSVR